MSFKTNLFALLLVTMSVAPFSATAAENAFFDIVTESASGPPYPTGNVVVNLLELGELATLEHTSTVLLSMSVRSDKATPKLLEAAAKGIAGGQEFVQFDLLYNGDGTDLEADTFFDITYRVEFQGQPGTTPQVSVQELFDPDGSLVASVNIGGHKAGGGGTGVARVGGKMHLEDVSMGIIAPAVNHSALDPSFEIAFRLHLVDPAMIAMNQPLVRLTFTAQSVPEPSSLWLAAASGIAWIGQRRLARRRPLRSGSAT